MTPTMSLFSIFILALVIIGSEANIEDYAGDYELTPTSHDMAVGLLFLANGIPVPALAGKTAIDTSLNPNDEGWLDDLEGLAEDIKKTLCQS